ncbi:15306_t:CDS:2, partial [Gigaspora margarita]
DMLQEISDLVIFDNEQGLNVINDHFLSQTRFDNDRYLPDNALQETSEIVIFDNNQDLLGLKTSDPLVFDNEYNSLDLNVNNSFILFQNDSGSDLYDIESVETDIEEIKIQNTVETDTEEIEIQNKQ